jgi:hypothetical protein
MPVRRGVCAVNFVPIYISNYSNGSRQNSLYPGQTYCRTALTMGRL